VPGVRIQHPTVRNARFTLTDPGKPYSEPYQCTPPEFGGCGAVHLFKTHHLSIDEAGSAIVNTVLYEQLKHYLVAHGFTEANVVAKPPTMGIGIGAQTEGQGAWGNIPIIRATGTDRS
jgi:hypothetical protein